MGMLDFIKTTAETSESHARKELRTRYYKCSYTKVKERVIEYAALKKIDVRKINDTYGEIYLQAKKFHMIVSVIQVNPRETAVEVKTNLYGFFGFGKPIKLVLELYALLNQKLELKGVSLHP